ncbi:MAG: hypothetical protein QM652_03020 [Legionella sp.]|uniref:hypothetical protein n=1 Tax=Legionella sp. TaxID=459 RepID=UPI0039E2C473
MNRIALFIGLILASVITAESAQYVKGTTHKIVLSGLQPGEGRFIKAAEYVNNQFHTGSYMCAGTNEPFYLEQLLARKSQIPFHEEHLIKFSICQDETMADCLEFATDKYLTFRNIDGYLENDISQFKLDLTTVKDAFKPCTPPEMDEKVKRSIHLSDRQFAHVG